MMDSSICSREHAYQIMFGPMEELSRVTQSFYLQRKFRFRLPKSEVKGRRKRRVNRDKIIIGRELPKSAIN